LFREVGRIDFQAELTKTISHLLLSSNDSGQTTAILILSKEKRWPRNLENQEKGTSAQLFRASPGFLWQ
jgi:hypothetical protein